MEQLEQPQSEGNADHVAPYMDQLTAKLQERQHEPAHLQYWVRRIVDPHEPSGIRREVNHDP